MGVASLVLGIIAVLVAWIPCVGNLAFLPAVIGLVLGICDAVGKHKKGLPKGIAIAGSVCSGVALSIIVLYYFLIASAAAAI